MGQFFDDSGRPVSTGRQFGRGGEGAVFEIHAQPERVAKIYHSPVPLLKREKLQAMVRCATPELLAIAAWPIATLRRSRGGDVVGFVMPRIAFRDIHQLYSPMQRKSLFPNADWTFLLRTARNCAAAFATLHKSGIVIGDVNQGNAQVSDQALVRLIDCDSFQFLANGKLYKCEVGVPHFTPPELQQANFSNVIRTQNHNCFGLALLIFHLLFVGRHPFAGCYVGSGDMPIERAISEHQFAYSRNGSRRLLTPPPITIPLANSIPSDVFASFEHAFGKGSEASNARPSAESWTTLLTRVEKTLRPCAETRGHVYPSASSKCPWCEIERTGGPAFFISVTIQAYGGRLPQIDVDALCLQIQSISFGAHTFQPARRPDLSKLVPLEVETLIQNSRFLTNLALAGTGFGVILCLYGFVDSGFLPLGVFFAIAFGVWWILQFTFSPARRMRSNLKKKVKNSRSDLDRAIERAQRCERANRDLFHAERSKVKQILDGLQDLNREKTTELHKLQATVQERQLSAFLDSFYISKANIKGIGPGRISTIVIAWNRDSV
jgi:DNA-binding helix-hairpin-helix protein with protein kinase domain